jgi:enamine deaminase RidA (YjgF/YER057c/UK114 family)
MLVEGTMAIRFLNPPALGPTFGWTHVTTSTGGTTVHVSGQVAVNAKGEVIGKGDLKAQTTQAFENLRIALEAAGATFADVVMSRLFVVGLKPDMIPTIREVRGRYFSKDNSPASTLVGVQALVGADWLIEIEVTAVVGG